MGMQIVHFQYTPFSNRIVILNVIPLVLLAQLHREKRNCNTSPKGNTIENTESSLLRASQLKRAIGAMLQWHYNWKNDACKSLS